MFSSNNWNGGNRGRGGNRPGQDGEASGNRADGEQERSLDATSGPAPEAAAPNATVPSVPASGTPPAAGRIYSRWPSRERFEAIVAEALEEIPDPLWEMIDNVAVMVEEWPQPYQLESVGLSDPRQLLGLYEGVPLTNRSSHYGLVAPDRITIFRRPIFGVCGPDEEKIRTQIRRTVLHEVAHHFGISDERLTELGAY